MPEETQPTQGVPETPAAEQTAAGSQPVEQTPAVSEPATPTSEGAKATESTPAPTGEQKTDSSSKQESKPQTHQSRRSSRFMPQRIQQLAKENAQLKQQQTPKPNESGAVDEWGNPVEATPNEQPDIAALVAQEVQKALNPVLSENSKTADDGEINELFAGDKASERAKYEEPIRKMWELPQYKEVAASDLYKILAYDSMPETIANAVAKGIEEHKQAQQEAKEASASGSDNTSSRTGNTGKSVADMTDAELSAHNERVKAGLPV